MNERVPSGHLQDLDWAVASTPNPPFHSLKTTDVILNLKVLAIPIIIRKIPQFWSDPSKEQRTHTRGSIHSHPFLQSSAMPTREWERARPVLLRFLFCFVSHSQFRKVLFSKIWSIPLFSLCRGSLCLKKSEKRKTLLCCFSGPLEVRAAALAFLLALSIFSPPCGLLLSGSSFYQSPFQLKGRSPLRKIIQHLP